MRVLITGVTGFVGSYLAEHLLEAESDIKIFGLKRWRSPLDNISHLLDKITLIDCDLTDHNSIISAFNKIHHVDTIYHLAAQSYVSFSFTSPSLTMQTNIIGTANLLDSLR